MLINSIDIPNNVILDVLNNSKAHEKELLYVGTLKKKDDKFILENIAYMDQVLPVKESFDIIKREMEIGGRKSFFY